MADVTIAIPTFNGEEFIDELLQAISSQDTKLKKEVLVIDSGSNDRTTEIVKKYPGVLLHEIPNSEFGHGRTRNLALQLAKGEYVIFLTQDAVPSHSKWLDSMIEPFNISSKVGCVFGRQIPRAHCFVTLKREVDQVFNSFGDNGSISLQRKNDLTVSLGVTNNFLSDANSAVRKSIAGIIPFKDVNYAEDQVLGIDMLDAGYIKAYAPLASVNHSHDYHLKKYYKRKFDECIGLRESTGYIPQASIKELFVGSFKSTVFDYIYIFKDKEFTFLEKIHDFLIAPFYNLATRLATRSAVKTQVGSKRHTKKSLETANRTKAKQ